MKTKPRKLYRYIITEIGSGKQEEIDRVVFTFHHDGVIEFFREGGDSLIFTAAAVTIAKA